MRLRNWYTKIVSDVKLDHIPQLNAHKCNIKQQTKKQRSFQEEVSGFIIFPKKEKKVGLIRK